MAQYFSFFLLSSLPRQSFFGDRGPLLGALSILQKSQSKSLKYPYKCVRRVDLSKGKLSSGMYCCHKATLVKEEAEKVEQNVLFHFQQKRSQWEQTEFQLYQFI